MRQTSEIRGQTSEVRSQKSEVRNLSSVFCLLFSMFCFFVLPCGCGTYGTSGKGSRTFTEEELAEIPLARRPTAAGKSGFPACSGGLVLAVNDDALTIDEVIVPASKVFGPLVQQSRFVGMEEFRKHAKPQLERFLWDKISELLLYQQAKKNLPDNVDEALEKAAEQEVSKFVAELGGDYAKAEKVLKERGLDWQGFREEQKKLIITRLFLSEQLRDNTPITHRELLKYYNEIKDELYAVAGTIEFRLIDIVRSQKPVPSAPVVSKVERVEGSEVRSPAEALAEQLVERANGGEDFGELAKEYSHGHRASQGGLWNPVQLGALAEPYDVLEEEAKKLKAGQVAGPIEADGHIFIMKLEKKRKQGFKPFEEIQYEVERRLVLERRKEALDKLLAKYIEQADIGDMETFVELCLQEIHRRYNR